MVKPFTVMRFLDWTAANTDGEKYKEYAQMESLDGFHGGRSYGGCIKLANDTGRHPWICLPVQATDDHFRKFAQYALQNLDPRLDLYVELSNELWNFGFPQAPVNLNAAKADGRVARKSDWEMCAERSAIRSVDMVKIIREVFGSQAGRVKLMLGSFIANQYWAQWQLEAIKRVFGDPKQFVHTITVAPYVGNDLNERDVPGLSMDALFNYLFEFTRGQCASWIRSNAAVASAWGVKLAAYEAGQHVVVYNNHYREKRNEALKRAAQYDPRMGAVLKELYAVWVREGGDLFCHSSLCGPYSEWGFWGLKENVLENTSTSPKWAAMMEMVKDNPPAVGGTPVPPPPPVPTPDPRNIAWLRTTVRYDDNTVEEHVIKVPVKPKPPKFKKIAWVRTTVRYDSNVVEEYVVKAK
jgi:hypothetical protein